MEIKFQLDPKATGKLTKAEIEKIHNEMLKTVTAKASELSAGKISWFEAGGYAKFSKGKAGV